jgi:CubicO group peptidase (beta-lactamase class C family)
VRTHGRFDPRRRLNLVLLAALVVGSSDVASQQRTTPIQLAELDAYVTRAVRDWRIPGLAIAVVKDDSIVFAKGYGIRELGKSELVDTGSRFAIGSTTKAMTAVALGLLVDEGKVRWDDPVIRHLFPWCNRTSSPMAWAGSSTTTPAMRWPCTPAASMG